MVMRTAARIIILGILVFVGCLNQRSVIVTALAPAVIGSTAFANDPHSVWRPDQAQMEHLVWQERVDSARKALCGTAIWHFVRPAGGQLDLDTRDLKVERVTDLLGRKIPFRLHKAHPVLGSRLQIALPPGTAGVKIDYETSPNASGLQWLTPEQTAGKKFPYLFSQAQAIHARSFVPLPDTPAVRFTFDAELTVPKELRGLMAGEFVSRQVHGTTATERWRMTKPIPSYLLAIAVGDLVSREIGPRSRVWAEPSVVEKARYEFGEIEKYLKIAERIVGPYPWGRYDILVMPPSFAHGGMENPMLTFVSPTLLVGDRSAVDVIVHELAHSWAGNLTGGASSARDFWLNEGLTSYLERRFSEAHLGQEAAALSWALAWKDLQKAVQDQIRDGHPEWTALAAQVGAEVDPDDAYSDVPYEKGAYFFRELERLVGRERFDRFLRAYFGRFAFRNITTEQFLAFVRQELPEVVGKVDLQKWVYEPGMPTVSLMPRSTRLEAIEALKGGLPNNELAGRWSPTEWKLYLESLPHAYPATPTTRELCHQLEARFGLTARPNLEIATSWLEVAILAGYTTQAVLARAERVVGEVGRMKFLKPLYKAVYKNLTTRFYALLWARRFGPRYHPIAVKAVEGIIAPPPPKP